MRISGDDAISTHVVIGGVAVDGLTHSSSEAIARGRVPDDCVVDDLWEPLVRDERHSCITEESVTFPPQRKLLWYPHHEINHPLLLSLLR